MPTKKYQILKDQTLVHEGVTLYRIQALKDFGNVGKGDLGGWIEKGKNLDQEGRCWVSGKGKVYGDACVFGDASVFDNADVSGNARVSGNAWVYGNAKVSGNAKVFEDAYVSGNANITYNTEVSGDAEISSTSVLDIMQQRMRYELIGITA